MGPRMRQHDPGAGRIFFAAAMTMVALVVGLGVVTAQLGPIAVPIWAIAIGGFVAVGRGPIGKAIAARIHPETALGDGNSMETQAVSEAVYAELDELRGRVAELEERQDFAERLLAGRDAPSPG